MEEYTYPRQQARRRRPHLPKWQRTVIKYWPVVRFSLLVLIVLAAIVLCITAMLK